MKAIEWTIVVIVGFCSGVLGAYLASLSAPPTITAASPLLAAPKWSTQSYDVAGVTSKPLEIPLEEHRLMLDSPPPVQDALPTADPALLVELNRLRKRIEWLETELQLCGSKVTTGPVGEWLRLIREDERPDGPTLRLMADYLRPYPVRLDVSEGLWLQERIREGDWKNWGPTIDEAIISFLGPQRIAREVDPERLASLREDWKEEGYFQ